jgi:hypothetical protein
MAGLSEVGLVPRLDVLPLQAIETAYPITEPHETRLRYLQKVSLADAMGKQAVHPGGAPFIVLYFVIILAIFLRVPVLQSS